jgi:hypothetical protein
MQSIPATFFEGQSSLNTWGLQSQLANQNSLAMVQMMRAPAFHATCPCPPMSTPQLVRSQPNLYKDTLKAQARIQTQQIDSAIQLLKMQYDSIMSSVQQSHKQPLEQLPPQPSSSASQVVDHESFSAQFDLPDPEFDAQVATAFVLNAPTTCKRKIDGHRDGISIMSLLDSESCPLLSSKSCKSIMPSNKRLRSSS